MWTIAILIILYFILLFFVVGKMIMENGSPARSLAWLFFILFVPVVGLIFYFLIGKNYRKEKLFRMKKTKDYAIYKKHLDQHFKHFEEEHLSESPSIRKKRRLVKLMMKNSKAILSHGNQVEILQDGKITFERIFEDLEKAKQYIHIQYYILEEGILADKLFVILSRKVKAGVTVRIIYDAVGSWDLSKDFIKKMAAAGIQIFPFMPVRFGKYANKINYRNHRKIIVIDGIIGFTGGANIADKYLENKNSKNNWRDTHLKIEGNAASSLQMIFLSDWYFVTGEYLFQKKDFFSIELKGGVPIQIVTSGPDSDYSSIKQEYFSLITHAEKYIYIWTPYFIPDENIMFSLQTAALSGVDVRMILPAESDSALLKWSTRSYVEELLRAGVKIFFYKKGFLHSKVLIADDLVASVGTANVDERSFENNFEVNAMIYDQRICEELKSQFAIDQANSEPILYQAFKLRPSGERFKESMAKLFSPLL
jgi:cardiolipin synthase